MGFKKSGSLLVVLAVVALVFTLEAEVTVPPLIKFAGVVKDDSGKALPGVVGITFSLYNEQQGGAALWMETTVRPGSRLRAWRRISAPPMVFSTWMLQGLAFRSPTGAAQPRVCGRLLTVSPTRRGYWTLWGPKQNEVPQGEEI